MKKIGKLLSIVFFLVVGATFAPQINSAIDWLAAVDYVALGETLKSVTVSIVDAAKAGVEFLVGLFEKAPKEVVQ